MARDTKQDTDNSIEREIARGDDSIIEPERRTKREPTYRIVGNTRVPVSKAHGSLWQSRRDQALQKRKSGELERAWSEALRYYRNDQTAHRTDSDDPDYAGNESGATKLTRRFSETENIVFANVSALVPSLYAKNPSAEFTATDPADEVTAPLLEKLTNRIMSKRAAPGINLKPKVRKAVVMCTLTNAAYIEVGYTFREQSSEAAMEDLAALAAELAKAKTPQQVEIIEGKIQALEETVDVLRPAGPWARFRRPQDVLIDPDALEDDHSDAGWLMIAEYISTAYLNARFAQRKGDKLVSVYKPTHVLARGSASGGSEGHNAAEMEIQNYTLFSTDDKRSGGATDYGYTDDDTFRKACRTKCWWVWDRTTRRVLLYTDKDWTWPVWVWDDPYHLQGFFSLFKLQFYTDPEEPMSKGEVTYYLDQQDAVNQMNSEYKQARQWARRNLFYDKNKVSRDEVERFIKGDEDVCVGVDVPEGMNLKDFVQSVVPPSMQFMQLFDKKPILEAIDRVSSVQPVMRGVEFKTNTTNQAINQYSSVQQTRTDEKIDAVEDFIGQIAWAVAQMCMQFMTTDDVARLIGDADSVGWQPRTADDIARSVQMTVVGGSTLKPTSEAKKQQALQMGQVLGQFVNAAPGPVLMVMLNTFRQAFNDVIPEHEWKSIFDGVAAQMQGGGGPAASEQGGEGAPQPSGAGGGAPGPAQGDPIAQVSQVLDALPPEAKEALGQAMARGVPAQEALARIMQLVQSQQQEPQQPA